MDEPETVPPAWRVTSPPLSPVTAEHYRAPAPRARRAWGLRRFAATAITAVALTGTGGAVLSAVHDAQVAAGPANTVGVSPTGTTRAGSVRVSEPVTQTRERGDVGDDGPRDS